MDDLIRELEPLTSSMDIRITAHYANDVIRTVPISGVKLYKLIQLAKAIKAMQEVKLVFLDILKI